MPDYEVRIRIKDVAEGDVRSFVGDILREHGDSFDADRGDFEVSASKVEGANTFSIDLDDEGGE